MRYGSTGIMIMVWWYIIAGGAVALIAYSRRGQNAVWGTATIAIPIGIVSAVFSTSVEWVDIPRFVAVGALIGLVFELPPFLLKRIRRAPSYPNARGSVRASRIVRGGYPATSHEGDNVSFRLSDGLVKMPSAPDIEGAEKFFTDQISNHTVLGFRGCSVMAKRQGGKAVLEYPLVMALLDETGSEVSMFVAAEKGVMFDTCMLGVFTNDGIHMNMGHWDLNAGEEVFLDKARTVFIEYLSRPRG